jgi:integrase
LFTEYPSDLPISSTRFTAVSQLIASYLRPSLCGEKMASTSKPPRKAKLSARVVEALQPLKNDYFVTDESVSKLKLKVTPTGHKSFVFRYRNALGQDRKLKLHDFPDLTVERARQLAIKYSAVVAEGGDPAADKRESRHGLTLSELGRRFMEEQAELHLKPSTIQNYRQLLRSTIDPDIGRLPIANIKRSQLIGLQRKMSSTKYQANRTIAFIRRLFNWAIQNELYSGIRNPALNIPPFRERTVESLLNEEEVERLWAAIRRLRNTNPRSASALNVIEFCWLTACRRGEAFKLKWEDVDFERSQLHFVEAKAGSRKHHISPRLRAFLEHIAQRKNSRYVFEGNKKDAPLTDIKKTWDAVRTEAGLSGFRLHDIRHNVLSDIASKYDLATAGAVGGHRSLRSTMRYAQARQKTTAAALDNIGEQVEGLARGEDT